MMRSTEMHLVTSTLTFPVEGHLVTLVKPYVKACSQSWLFLYA